MGGETGSDRQTQLEEQLKNTEQSLNELQDIITNLQNRLSPILFDESPPKEPGEVTPDSNLTPRASQVREIQRAIDGCISRISDIIKRAEC